MQRVHRISLLLAKNKLARARALQQVPRRSVSERLSVVARSIASLFWPGTSVPVDSGAIVVSTPTSMNVRVYLAAYMIK